MAEIGKWGTSTQMPHPLSATPTIRGVALLGVRNTYTMTNLWLNGMGFIQINQ